MTSIASPTTGIQGDVLNISNLIEGYDSLSDDINDFIKVVEKSGATTVAVDTNGGGDHYVALATLQGAEGLSVQALLDDGNIVVIHATVL